MLIQPPPTNSSLSWESLTAGQQQQLTSHLARLLHQYVVAYQATRRQTTKETTTKEIRHEQPTPR
jgi:ribosomal protein L4